MFITFYPSAFYYLLSKDFMYRDGLVPVINLCRRVQQNKHNNMLGRQQGKKINVPPPLNIRTFKNRLIFQSHLHDENLVAQSLTQSESVYQSLRETPEGEQQSTPMLGNHNHKSKLDSLIMIDSPAKEHSNEGHNSTASAMGNFRFNVHKVECLGHSQPIFVDSFPLDNNSTEPKVTISRAEKNQKTAEIDSSPTMINRKMESPPQLKYVKSISFRRQSDEYSRDNKQKEKEKARPKPKPMPALACIRQRYSKNPQSVNDSTHREQSQKKIAPITSEANKVKQQKDSGGDALFNLLSFLLPINSNIKQTETPHKSSQKYIKDQTPNDGKYSQTPLSRISPRTEHHTNSYVTHKKKPSQSIMADSTTEHQHRTARNQEGHHTLSAKKTNNGLYSQINKPGLQSRLMTSQKKQQSSLGNHSIENTPEAQKPLEKRGFFQNEQNTKQLYMKLISTMSNQKNLKLKDYLRLTSLSNDSRFDRYSKSLSKPEHTQGGNFLAVRQNQQKNNDSTMSSMKKSFIFNRNRTAIDPQKSIKLIKASLKKKLEKAIESAYQVLEQLSKDEDLIGSEYEDLVFMCNFHRVFDENLFKTVGMLEALLQGYKEKRVLGYFAQGEENLTEDKVREVDEVLSPTKKSGKKKKLQKLELNLIERMLLRFNICHPSQLIKKDSLSEKTSP